MKRLMTLILACTALVVMGIAASSVLAKDGSDDQPTATQPTSTQPCDTRQGETEPGDDHGGTGGGTDDFRARVSDDGTSGDDNHDGSSGDDRFSGRAGDDDERGG